MKVQSYRVRWWGCPGSKMGRPTYHILHLDNCAIQVRQCIVPGRPLGNYVLPYWPIRSYLSIMEPPAELAHVPRTHFSGGGGPQEVSFVIGDSTLSHKVTDRHPSWASFHLARKGPITILMMANEGSGSLVRMEHYFRTVEGQRTIRVLARTLNTTREEISDVQTRISYQQGFNWSDFGEAARGAYRPARDSGAADGFYAFSAGMERGFEFGALDGCRLSYTLDREVNGWRVDLTGPRADLGPGESSSFGYGLRLGRQTPTGMGDPDGMPTLDPTDFHFTKVRPKGFGKAPVGHGGQVSMDQMLQDLQRPKVRGLNLKASFPRALADVDTLAEWGCNLLIMGMYRTGEVLEASRKAHSLGMQVLLQGRGSYEDGPPSFDSLKGATLDREDLPDSYGQDEDHYYWHPVRSTRDFCGDFGEPAALATQNERVAHFSRCFADKWRGVLEDVRTINSRAGIWFYTPCPGIANVDPLDYYDVFIREVAGLGKALTVFPFYYGTDYGQAEYMVRRWKMGGASSVVFLPMRDFMARPSQFVRAVTAARRGGADGACGFSFAVGESAPGEEWQWKSVMLGGWANFPTSDLGAFCCIEEPAALVEKLGTCKLTVAGAADRTEDLASRLDRLIPRGITTASKRSKSPSGDELVVVVDEAGIPDHLARFLGNMGKGRGILSMEGDLVTLQGSGRIGNSRAVDLLVRFAELAHAEATRRP